MLLVFNKELGTPFTALFHRIKYSLSLPKKRLQSFIAVKSDL